MGTKYNRTQQKRGEESVLNTKKLRHGELGYTDTKKLFIGNEEGANTQLFPPSATDFEGVLNVENGGSGRTDGKAAALAVPVAIEGIAFDGTVDLNRLTTSATSGATAVKEASLANFVKVNGATLYLVFAEDNTAESPQLKIGTTTASHLVDRANPDVVLKAGRVYHIIFRDTVYEIVGSSGVTDASGMTYDGQNLADVLDQMLIDIANAQADANKALEAITDLTSTINTIPTQNGSLTYTGSSQSPLWNGYDTNALTLTGTITGTNAGTYTATFTPKEGYKWWDGTTTAKNESWVIAKAAGSLSLSPTSLTLNPTNLTGTITVTRVGNGVVSAVSSDTSIATVSVSGTTITVNNVNKETGEATITVSVAAGTNHLAPANQLCAVTAKFTVVSGVRIDLSNSNPNTAVTYLGDATGMEKGSSAWDSVEPFVSIKPCVFLNGVRQYYLNKNNYAQKEDGTASTINSTTAGDVMIEIPKLGFKITTSGSILTVEVTNQANVEGFNYYAHTRATEGDCNYLYIGAYLGYGTGNKLYSISGQTPTASQTHGTFRTWAQAKGTGYDIMDFYSVTLLQCLYLLKYANLDSQTALGRGYVDGNSAAITTGGTNAKGFNFGETTGKLQMKMFGIEDFWGNLYTKIDGIFCNASWQILTAFQNFNDTGSGYPKTLSSGLSANYGGYMSKPQGDNDRGFNVKEASGSATTYFCDSAYLSAGSLAFFGGGWSSADTAGVFRLNVSMSAANTSTGNGARVMYRKAGQ